MLSLIKEYDLPNRFPEEVNREAEALEEYAPEVNKTEHEQVQAKYDKMFGTMSRQKYYELDILGTQMIDSKIKKNMKMEKL